MQVIFVEESPESKTARLEKEIRDRATAFRNHLKYLAGEISEEEYRHSRNSNFENCDNLP